MTTNLITSLPESLSCCILSEWLTVRQLVRLDSAFCKHSLRKSLLDLYRSDELVNQQMWLVTGYETFEWLLLRGVKVARFGLAIDIRHIAQRDLIARYFALQEQHIREIKAQSAVEGMMHNVVINCKHLTRFTCAQPSFGNCDDLAAILRNNQNLQELVFTSTQPSTDCTEFEDIKLPSLTMVSYHNYRGTLSFLNEIAKMTSSLHRLSIMSVSTRTHDLSFSGIAQLCPLLRSLELHCPFVYDTEIDEFVTLCPHIVNLSIVANGSLTDSGVLTIVQNLKLRTLCVQQCSRITDLSVQYIAEYCASTLTLLYLDSEKVTLPALDELRAKCGSKLTIHSRRVIYREIYFENCSTATILQLSFDITELFICKLGECCTRLEVLDLSNCPNLGLTLAKVSLLCEYCPYLHTIVLKPRDREEYFDVLKARLRVTIECPGSRYELDKMPM